MRSRRRLTAAATGAAAIVLIAGVSGIAVMLPRERVAQPAGTSRRPQTEGTRVLNQEVARGSRGGGAEWRLLASQVDDSVCGNLIITRGGRRDSFDGCFSDGLASDSISFLQVDSRLLPRGEKALFGVARPEAAFVEFLHDGRRWVSETFAAPEEMDAPMEFIVAFGPSGADTFQVLGSDGSVLEEHQLRAGPATPSESPAEESPNPTPVVPEHGGTYWGLYLAVVAGDDASHPKLERAARNLRADGFDPSVGGIDCNPGAREGLGLDGRRSYSHVALYFDSEADAQAFADDYDTAVYGIAGVQTLCLD